MRNRSKVTEFLTERALPLWSDIGFDQETGSFVERLTGDGRPDFTVPKRVRVQARQIYVYAHAATLGLWPNGEMLALQAFAFLDHYARAPEPGEGFVHAVSRHGEPIDTRCDSYDHAFLLFAFSWLYKATGTTEVRRAMDDVVTAIDRRLMLPSGGVAVDSSGTTERQQNPNMHLFEAYLAAAAATGDERFLTRANEQAALFEHRLFDRQSGVLREFYGPDWAPAPGERGMIVEPGHHCEWAWLLKRHADAQRRAVCEQAMHLMAFVERHGRPAGSVLLCDQVAVDGTMLKADLRVWPQTEAIKAEIALAEIADAAPSARVDNLVDALFDRFLDRPVPGAWVDWIDTAGNPLVATVPASTLYHIFLAFAEYLAVSES